MNRSFLRSQILWAFFLWACNGFAWTEHFRVTDSALIRSVADSEKIPFESLTTALAGGIDGLPVKTEADLRAFLKINKQYAFELKLGESVGLSLPLRGVLSTYSDEPDWGVDRELFETDQYPNLWTEDTKYVSGKHGPSSQGFRHMYFPGKFSWREPIATLQVPMRAVGENPERAQLFYDLAISFLRQGHLYWGYRFAAWAIHYAEDLYQPFHVRQTPSKAFVIFTWKNGLPRLDISETAEQIAYYHYSYEQWVSDLMRDPHGELQKRLQAAQPVAPLRKTIRAFLLEDVLTMSSGEASAVGRGVRSVFPPLPPHSRKATEVVGTPEWRAFLKQGTAPGELNESTGRLFSRMGDTVRTLVGHLKNYPPQIKN